MIESIVTVRELCEGTCFGVKGYAECGVPYPPDVSAAHREIRTDTALKTASGFGAATPRSYSAAQRAPTPRPEMKRRRDKGVGQTQVCKAGTTAWRLPVPEAERL